MTFKKQYRYFVSYTYKNTEGHGSGMCELIRKRPIKNYEDIKDTMESIKNELGFKEVVILNYKRIK